MPANPDHSTDTIPLTSQGWNWSLADAKTYVQSYGMLEIGQMYKTTDGKTHLVIDIPAGVPSSELTYYVRYTQSVTRGVTVDWGDGNSETFTGTSATNRSHTYSAPGTYDITLDVTSGNLRFVGSSSQAIYGATSNYYNRSRLKLARIGLGVTYIGDYCFYYCYTLKSITLPSNVTTISQYAFSYCSSLAGCLTVPSGVSSAGVHSIERCGCLTSISLPKSLERISGYNFQYDYALKRINLNGITVDIGTYAFRACYGLEQVKMPTTITKEFETNVFLDCYSLKEIPIPSGVTAIPTGFAQNCCSAKSITIPATVTSIAASAFSNCYSAAYIRLYPTTPPSLSNANAFSGIPTDVKFIVPKASKSTYQGASIWSTYSSRIIGDDEV